jgi:hypothetical protein
VWGRLVTPTTLRRLPILPIGAQVTNLPHIQTAVQSMERLGMRSLAWKARDALAGALRFLTGRRPDPPDDPHAAVRVPIKRGPPDKSAAVALDEPD